MPFDILVRPKSMTIALIVLGGCNKGAGVTKSSGSTFTDSGSIGPTDSELKDSAIVDDTSDSVDSVGADSGSDVDSVTIDLDGGSFVSFGDSYSENDIGAAVSFLSDISGDGLPEILTYGDQNVDSGSWSSIYIIGSDVIGSLNGSLQINDHTQLVIENIGYPIYPFAVGDLDGDSLGDVMLPGMDLGVPPSLIWGSTIASASGLVRAEDLVDMYLISEMGVVTVSFSLSAHAGFFSDPLRVEPDLLFSMSEQVIVVPSDQLIGPTVAVDDVGACIIYCSSGGPGVPDHESYMGISRALGDLDGDGLDEVAMGSLGVTAPTLGEIFYGSSLDFSTPLYVGDADVLFTFPPTSDGIRYNQLFTTLLGDVTGDGVDDLIMGRGELEYDGLTEVGGAWFWSGARLSTPGMLDAGDGDVHFYATDPWAQVGESAADVGDVDEDGLSDFLLHGAGWDGDTRVRPFVHLIRGSEMSGGGSYDINEATVGFQSDKPLGSYSSGSYAGGQDADGDGVNDLLIANSEYGGPGVDGRLWFLSGALLDF